MLVSLPILIALRHIIYHWKQIDKHFSMHVQLYKSVQPFIYEILADKAFTATDSLISQLFGVTFVHPTYVQIALI